MKKTILLSRLNVVSGEAEKKYFYQSLWRGERSRYGI